jgi:hypothetical protein
MYSSVGHAKTIEPAIAKSLRLSDHKAILSTTASKAESTITPPLPLINAKTKLRNVIANTPVLNGSGRI